MDQRYYRKSKIAGGGGRSFIGFSIPDRLTITKTGIYHVPSAAKKSINIAGTGIDYGNYNQEPMKVVFNVIPNDIITTIIN